jgi:hypothetical protein
MLWQIILSLLAAVAAVSAAADRRLPPVDQCASDPSFVAFRNELLSAIERRDRDAVLALVANDIEVDFGGGAGREEFARTWALDRPRASPLWSELRQALSLGCARDPAGEYYASPSMYMADESIFPDPFTAAVAIRPDAQLRAAPDAGSALVATLNWHVLTVPEWDRESAWQRVELADGRRGHVRSEDLRSAVDYRAIFERVDGRWRITAFIAGD